LRAAAPIRAASSGSKNRSPRRTCPLRCLSGFVSGEHDYLADPGYCPDRLRVLRPATAQPQIEDDNVELLPGG
jgi:hypothetical protein